MAAHYDNGLPHQEHKNTPNKGQHQYGYAAQGYYRNGLVLFGKIYEVCNQPIVLYRCFLLFNTKSPLHHIKYITGDLWGQHGKVVGNNNKKNSQEKPVPVFPEIYIKRF